MDIGEIVVYMDLIVRREEWTRTEQKALCRWGEEIKMIDECYWVIGKLRGGILMFNKTTKREIVTK